MNDSYIRKAAMFAEDVHGAQRRKFTNEPYFAHVERVATTVGRSIEYGHDHEVIAAAYLHDVIEDTDTLLIDLERLGMTERTVHIVDVLTKPERLARHSYIMQLVNEPEAWVIKRADITDNLSTLPAESSLWQRYPSDLAVLHQHRPAVFPSPFPSPYDETDGLLGTGA